MQVTNILPSSDVPSTRSRPHSFHSSFTYITTHSRVSHMSSPSPAETSARGHGASGDRESHDLAGLQLSGRRSSPTTGRQPSPRLRPRIFWPRLQQETRPTIFFGPSSSNTQLPSSDVDWIEQELLVEEEEEPDSNQVPVNVAWPPNVDSPFSSSKCNV